MQFWTSRDNWFRRIALIVTFLVAAGLAWILLHGTVVRPVNPELVLLLLTLLVAANLGLRWGLVSAVVCNFVLADFFLEPKLKPWADDGQELASMVVFLIASAIGSSLLELANAARRTEALEQADEMKMAILASISHDLRTPLATIRASVSSLLNPGVQWSSADNQAFLMTIKEEANELDRTISDLLALNRVESGAVQPNIREESIVQIASDAIEMKADVIGERNLVVQVPDLTLATDGSLVRQALANLLENAALHSKPGGAITVSAVMRGKHVDLSVEDEGPGVDADELPYIFNPYYRARGGKAAPNGSGLGLAIVKGFVALCGGTVRAESGPSATRFTISLTSLSLQPVQSAPLVRSESA